MVKTEWDLVKKFKGEWVAVCDSKVMAHGLNGKEVYKKAVKLCKSPRLFQVPTEEDEVYLL